MQKFNPIVPRWLPAVVMMLAIFIFSSIPSTAMPRFDLFDTIIKKGGHMLGYGLLALAYLRWFPGRTWLAFGLAVAYGCGDEFHQSFVPGRGPSVWDVLLFDAPGAALALFLYSKFRKEEDGKTLQA